MTLEACKQGGQTLCREESFVFGLCRPKKYFFTPDMVPPEGHLSQPFLRKGHTK